MSKTKSIIKRNGSFLSNKGRALQHRRSYPVTKKLNKSLVLLVLLLMAVSFQVGMMFKPESLVTSTSVEIEEVSSEVAYKEIVFEKYIKELNKIQFTDYRDYLTEARRVKNKFRRDLEYNREVFIAQNYITREDQPKYDQYSYEQSKLRDDFYRLLDKHRDVMRKEIRIRNNLNRLVRN